MNLVAQVKRACASKNRLATLLGFLLGGFVPVAIYFTAHRATFAWGLASPAPGLVLGGLVYSAQTVFQWGKLAFHNALKATGFCVLIEGVMVTSQIHWLSIAALIYLVCINGIATGVTISIGVQKKKGF